MSCLSAASGEKLPHLDGRIVGGTTTTIEEYPYQISLQYYGRHICGGSIISNEIVVTAAHCTDSMSLSGLSVRAGSSFSGKGGVVISVKKIIQHKNFNQKTMDYDISILELSEPLLFNSSIQPINLPATNNRLIEGAESVCTGWGATREGGSGSSQLQTVTVPIVSQEVCQIGYGEAVITEQMICAGITKGGKDACQVKQYLITKQNKNKLIKLFHRVIPEVHWFLIVS